MHNAPIHTIIDGQPVIIPADYIKRYDSPLPRYTSYPPVPSWAKDIKESESTYALMHSCTDALSLYVHLPFCRTRCTFCACNAIATGKTEIIDRYIDALTKEMDLLSKYINLQESKVVCIHWGGGTPNYLSPAQAERLHRETWKRWRMDTNVEAGIEVDPVEASSNRIRQFRGLGFNRISFGVQDTDPRILEKCGRKGDLKHIKNLMDQARGAGFKSINIDLCYGLPGQTPTSFKNTIQEVINLVPDRLALFNFAYVPHMHPNQRSIDPASLPDAHAKLSMFAQTINDLGKAGYEFIGLDHFAKAPDELALAKRNGTLTRTFQGYSASSYPSLIGLGVTAISQYGGLYVQNERKLIAYLRRIFSHQLPATRGYYLSYDDRITYWVMQKIFCQQKIEKIEFENKWGAVFDDYFKEIRLDHLIQDGLLENTKSFLKITPLGRLFIRHVAAAFDKYLSSKNDLFSKAI